MSKHSTRVALTHMRSHADEARTLVQNISRDEFDTNRLLHLSLVRLLEIVGEAARRVPEKIQEYYSDIPWSQIISLRNRLIHGYDAIDYDILWKILTNDLPPLVARLDTILAEDDVEK